MKLVVGRAAVGLAVVLLIVIAVANRQAPSDGSSGVAEVVLEEMRFKPNRINAKVGVPLTLRLTNEGTERHDLNFESIHMPGLRGVESILEPGETRSITLTFDEPGTHLFICTLPGHAAAGMTGALFVSP